jgi:glycosyl-4,4'-diaponeurosporenoate acyltransferase
MESILSAKSFLLYTCILTFLSNSVIIYDSGDKIMELNPEKFAAVLIVSQIAASVVADHLSEETLQGLRKKMKSFKWEQNGEIYQQYFHIRSWKDLVPEMGNQFSKDHMTGTSEEYLNQFALECTRAELCHAFALFLAIPLILESDPSFFQWATLYSLLANVPFIMIQRYNRPRFEKLLNQRGRMKDQSILVGNPSSLLSHQIKT